MRVHKDSEKHFLAQRKMMRRFTQKYEQRRVERDSGEHSKYKRPIRVTIGFILIITGVAIGWLPGPGFVVLALPGAFLIASEVHWMAKFMDHVEHVTMPHIFKVWARLRGKPKDHWVEHYPDLWPELNSTSEESSKSDECDRD